VVQIIIQTKGFVSSFKQQRGEKNAINSIQYEIRRRRDATFAFFVPYENKFIPP